MIRDTSNTPSASTFQRPEWDTGPKSGQGSEYGKEARELARRRKYGYLPKLKKPDDLPWILTNKGNEKEKIKDKQ